MRVLIIFERMYIQIFLIVGFVSRLSVVRLPLHPVMTTRCIAAKALLLHGHIDGYLLRIEVGEWD
jgi:hypothetical protein